jgi:ABC-2 type transport system ATP-binding protein
VRIAGHDLRTERAAVRRAIGRVPQEIAVYPTLSAVENAVFFARLAGLRPAAARRSAAAALERVGLTSRAHDAAASYSGGMQRRSTRLRPNGSPPVLLLDEPGRRRSAVARASSTPCAVMPRRRGLVQHASDGRGGAAVRSRRVADRGRVVAPAPASSWPPRSRDCAWTW